MNGKTFSSLAFCIAITLAAAGSFATEPGHKESIERLKLLFTPAAVEGQTPAPAAVAVDVLEGGILTVTRHAELDRSQYRFSSKSEETWRVLMADLDVKRIAVHTDPLSVYVPVKKDINRVMVVRHEAKTRAASDQEPGKQWHDENKFTTNFVVIPVETPEQADETADLLKQIIKTTPKKK